MQSIDTRFFTLLLTRRERALDPDVADVIFLIC